MMFQFKTAPWSWFVVLLAWFAKAQDININVNPQLDPNNPLSSSSTNNYQDVSNPSTPSYSSGVTDHYDRGNRPDQLSPFGINNNNNDQYERGPRGQDNPVGSNQYDQLDKDDQFGQTPSRSPYKPAGWKQFDEHMTTIAKATYFIVASKTVRPGQLYRVAVTVLKLDQPITVRASISRNGVELTEDHKNVREYIPETLVMQVPPTSTPGDFKLRVEGLYDNMLGGAVFSNESKLIFSQRSMTIFIQLDKPVYMQGDTVRFRSIPINTELKTFNETVDVFMLDPNGHIMKRWLSRQSNLGAVSLDYQLSDQPVFGEWKVRVVAQNQIEESAFLVEEYYQTRFEVNVAMPAFFSTTDEFIEGVVVANFTSGAPVRGNLTLKAVVRPIKPYDPDRLKKRHHRSPYDSRQDNQYQYNDHSHGGHQYDQQQYNQNRNQYDNKSYDNQYDLPYGYGAYNNMSHYQASEYNRPITEKYFNFNQSYPVWVEIPYNYSKPIPSLEFFYGVYKFKYPIQELLHYVSSLEGMEVVVVATVGERFYDEVIEGFSTARIFNSSIKLSFLGGSPQVFKPGMPITAYIAASYHDGSSLSVEKLENSFLEVTTVVDIVPGGTRNIATRQLHMMDGHPGMWEYTIDLKSELGLVGCRTYGELSGIKTVKIHAHFRDGHGQFIQTDLFMQAHHSPNGQNIKVYTSTTQPTVGEHMIFHIKSSDFNFERKFNYLVIAKGIVLVAGEQEMLNHISEIRIPLSAEMAPVTTIVVWHLSIFGGVTVDSLTFPVNGISRSKFKVSIYNKEANGEHKVEIAVYGEPGSYVSLSGIDRAFYTMQAGNELTYAKVLTKMSTFEDGITNGTLRHTWFSHEGNPDELVHFPSSTYGIDANRTFELAGLVVFSDFVLPRRWSYCNYTQGFGECLNGRCFRLDKRCDFILDCEDGTDEAGCTYDNGTELALFRKYRFNRIQRQYENVWVWKDITIGPHGRYIFNVPVPARPVHWMVSAFSMSPSLGFGMLNKAVEYIGVLPFFINVEMPNLCMQGEQVGIRVTVFNYMTDVMETTVVLGGSPDYKFVHVDKGEAVFAYNPRTTHGEHPFFISIKPQDAQVVYIPIVPTRLGDIDVTVYASTLIGKDQITRRIRVEADGLPQYRHQSMLLDLSNKAYAFQYMHVNITETPIIPYEYDRYYVYGSNRARVSIVGDVVGPIFPTMPVNATSLLHLPMDCAEQNMFSFAANMYAMLYMRYTQQRNRTLERLAFHHMNIVYQRQLSFMQPDGSFSTFRSDWNQSDSSVWLTSYCARVFQEASFHEWENYIYIDPEVISKAVEWVLKHQTEYGSFYEPTWLPDRKYNATYNFYNDHIRQRNITLTAHVLIMLESVKDLNNGLSSKVAIAKKNAIHWLERNMDLIKEQGRAFDVAIVAYALMKSKAPLAETAFLELSRQRRLEGGLMYWGRESIPQPPYKIENQRPFLLPRLPYQYDSENIEATSYALMVYVARQDSLMDNIVRWLNTQRLTDGGWASTADTGVALKALIEYTSVQKIRNNSSLSVTIEASSLPGKTQMLFVDDKNRAHLQHIDIPNAWGTVKVQGNGTGYAILQMSVQYNVDVAGFQTKPPVPAFDLRIRSLFSGRNLSHITFHSCQSWTHMNESERSGMAVLDVTIPTGYMIQQQDLDAYVLSRQVRNLQRARFSERKVLFYFDYLDREETCINFTVERWYPVANMSRYLPIRVYDYYAPERFNETIFDAVATYVLDICQVCGSSQCPYCWKNTSANIPISFSTSLFKSIILIARYLYFQLQDVINKFHINPSAL